MAGKTYLVTFPDGETERVTNLNAFCRKHGLSQPNMSKVVRGKISNHQGFFAKEISSAENSQFELLEKKRISKIIEICDDFVKTPYAQITFEQKNNLIISLYAIQKAFGEMK